MAGLPAVYVTDYDPDPNLPEPHRDQYYIFTVGPWGAACVKAAGVSLELTYCCRVLQANTYLYCVCGGVNRIQKDI